jgi:glycosyltransferase involved in cell wall biosynthesis
MRVLLATYFALPNAGGLWTYVDQLKHGFERMGHEVDLIAQHPDCEHYHVLNKGLTFQKAKALPLIERVVEDTFLQNKLPLDEDICKWEIERYLMEAALAHFGLKKYDVIHTQDIISTRAASRVKPRHTPLVATIHGCMTQEMLYHGEIRERDSLQHAYMAAHEQLSMMSAHEVIVPSQWIKNLFVEEFDVPDGQIRVVMNGMDINAFVTRMKEQPSVQRPSEKKVIACNARLDKIKGHVHLFQALAKVKAERQDWVCWLIGDGEMREELEATVEQLGLADDVVFLGTRSDVPTLFNMADICVLPSLQENCPFALMEAQVAGRAIIASEVGGVPEMIRHEQTGLLTTAGDSETLYGSLMRVLAEEDLRHTLGENAKKWGRVQWSLDTMRAQTLSVYDRAMRRK